MKKKVILIPIIAVLAILLIASGVFAYLYFATDTFKSNKEMFKKYISQNAEYENVFKIDELNQYIQKQKTMSYSCEGNIKMNMSSTNAGLQEEISKLQNTSITFLGNVDQANKYYYGNIRANYSDTQSIGAEIVKKDDVVAIKINDVINKFIGIQNNNLKDAARKLGLNEETIAFIPDKINLQSSQIQGFQQIFTETEKKQLKEKYFKIFTDNLTDDMFTCQKSDNGNIYVLSFTEDKAESIIKKILLQLQNDDLIFNKIRTIMINYAGMTQEEANTFISRLQQVIQEVVNENNSTNTAPTTSGVEQTSSQNNMYIKVYTQNNKLVKTELSISNTTISISKIESGLKLEFSDNTMLTPYSFTMQKSSSADNFKYDFGLLQGANQLVTLKINYTGINTNQVQENSEFTFNYNSINNNLSNTFNGITDSISSGTNYVCTYTNTKSFGNANLSNIVSNGDIITINSAPNKEKAQELITMVAAKFIQVNNSKMVAAGLNPNSTNPFMYYLPAVVPVGSTSFINNIENSAILLAPLARLSELAMITVESARDTIENYIDNNNNTSDEFTDSTDDSADESNDEDNGDSTTSEEDDGLDDFTTIETNI